MAKRNESDPQAEKKIKSLGDLSPSKAIKEATRDGIKNVSHHKDQKKK
jgi:DNA-directed RNA polymerase subunit L